MKEVSQFSPLLNVPLGVPGVTMTLQSVTVTMANIGCHGCYTPGARSYDIIAVFGFIAEYSSLCKKTENEAIGFA